MAKEKQDLREELQQLRFDMKFLQKIDCTKEENKAYSKMIKNGEALPNGVYQYRDSSSGEYISSFYTVWEPELTDAEKREYIQYQELLHIKTIKNCALFFTTLAVISLIVSLLLLVR